MTDYLPINDPPPSTRWPLALRALQHRPFQIMYGGEAISLIGTWMQQIALSWLVYRLTGSSLLLGSVAFAGQIPILLLAPFGGLLADRHNRRNILIVTQSVWVIHASVLAALTITGTIQVWQILMLSALSGVFSAFDMPARQAFVVDLVGKDDLPNAIALNNALINGATVAGPVFASLLVARLSEGACFFANAISKAFVIASLFLIKVEPVPQTSHTNSPLEDIKEALHWVRFDHSALSVLWLVGVIALLGMPITVLMPVVAANVLDGSPTALGILMSAYGMGALLGSIPLAFRKNARGLTRWMTYATAILGVFLIVFGVSDTLLASAALLVPVGVCLILVLNISITLIQSIAPERLRGRAMALHLMVFMGLGSLGSFVLGLIAELTGASVAIAGCGVGCLLGAVAFGYAMRHHHANVDHRVVSA